jgi:hypothetical protein
MYNDECNLFPAINGLRAYYFFLSHERKKRLPHLESPFSSLAGKEQSLMQMISNNKDTL